MIRFESRALQVWFSQLRNSDISLAGEAFA